MQTWVIMMGLNLFASLVCFVAIMWFRNQKDEEFDDFIDSNEKNIEGGDRA